MKIRRLLFTALIMLFVIVLAVPSSALTVKPATPKDNVVDNPYDGVAFEVLVTDYIGSVTFNWVQCYKDGMPVDHTSVGNGQAFYLHSVPESGEKVYYKCVVTDGGGSKEIIFSAKYEEEVVDIEIIQEPKKKDYKIGEYIDLAGIKVRVLTSMGYKDITDASKFTVDPVKVTKTGITHVYVKYKGFQDMYTVTCTASATAKPTATPKSTSTPEAAASASPSPEATKEPYATVEPGATADIGGMDGPGGILITPGPDSPAGNNSFAKLISGGLLVMGLVALGAVLLLTGTVILIIILCKKSSEKKAAQNSADKSN